MKPSDLAYRAMIFACQVHASQRRKYTNNPHSDHETATRLAVWNCALEIAKGA
jgi:hypothetical protein